MGQQAWPPPCAKLVCLFDAEGALTHIKPMRRALRFLPFLLILPAGALPVVSGLNAPRGGQIAQDISSADLARLFAQLRYSETAEDAAKIEADIFIRLTASPSPTINLLLENTNAALNEENLVAAKAIMADVVRLNPEFAEGLTRAALLAYQDGELEEAHSLLQQAVLREPRHFGAWAGLGLVREDLGDLKGAQDAYREAAYFHPFLDSAKRGLIRLEAKIDGLSL
jgi:tetratricopeptide (TPR) repeat protein